MIDINEAYPNAQQIIKLDLKEDCNRVFESLKGLFEIRRGTIESKSALSALIEYEILAVSRFENKDYSTMGKYINFPHYKEGYIGYNGISLQPLFYLGWINALKGDFTVQNDCYKNEIRMRLGWYLEKVDPPYQYFEELSRRSIEEVISGMGYLKYFHWLKDLRNGEFDTEKIKNVNTLTQQTKLPRVVNGFSHYLQNTDKEKLAEALKNEFTTEIGKGVRLILEVLLKHNKFSFGYRQNQAIFNAMALYFKRVIGTKQSIFDCKIIIDDPDFKVIETKILSLLKTIEKQ